MKALCRPSNCHDNLPHTMARHSNHHQHQRRQGKSDDSKRDEKRDGKRGNQQPTLVAIVYTTASPTFTGSIAGYTTIAAPLTQAAPPATTNRPPPAPAPAPSPASQPASDTEQDEEDAPATNTQEEPEPEPDQEEERQEEPAEPSQEASSTRAAEEERSSELTSTDQPSSTSSSSAAEETRSQESSSSTSEPATSTTSSASRVQTTSFSSVSSSLSSSSSSTTDGITNGLSSLTSSGSSAPAASQTLDPSAASSTGLSGGAKAGIAFGVLLGVGAIVALILFCLRRKRNRQEGYTITDDEKVHTDLAGQGAAAMTHRASSIKTARTLSTAPRLSLRPVTQFEPNFVAEKGGPGGSSKAAAPSVNHLTIPPASVKMSANDSTNPFGAHAETSSPVTAGPAVTTAGPGDRSTTWPAAPSNPTDPEKTPVDTGVGAAVVAAAAAAQQPKTPPTNGTTVKTTADGHGSSAAVAEPTIQAKGPAAPGTSILAAMPAPPASPRSAAGAAGGSGGLAPVHRVQMDFKPSMSDELELRAGQLVRILHEYDDGWARCVRLDGSQQGVAPRTCLSSRPVKPRPMGPPPGPAGPPRQGPPPPGSRYSPTGGPPRGPPGIGMVPRSSSPRPLNPANGRHSPGPSSYTAYQPRPLSPASSGRHSSSPYGPHARPMSPGGASNRSHSPGPRGMTPRATTPTTAQQQRARSNSVAPFPGAGRVAGPPAPGNHHQPPQRLPTILRSGSPSPSATSMRALSTSPPVRKPLPGQAS